MLHMCLVRMNCLLVSIQVRDSRTSLLQLCAKTLRSRLTILPLIQMEMSLFILFARLIFSLIRYFPCLLRRTIRPIRILHTDLDFLRLILSRAILLWELTQPPAKSAELPPKLDNTRLPYAQKSTETAFTFQPLEEHFNSMSHFATNQLSRVFLLKLLSVTDLILASQIKV